MLKKHKEKLLIAAGGAVILGTAAYGIFTHYSRACTELKCPTLEQGTLDFVRRKKYGDHAGCEVAGMLHVPVAHLGKVGEKLCEVDGIKSDTLCTVLLGTEK